nr:hypothetical protein CFP56_75639 [Quercus suber]
MASAHYGLSSSSSTSSALPTMATSSLSVNSSLLLLSNMSSMMTVKLEYGNYIVWKHQIKVILDTYSMIDVLDDSIMAPDRFLKDSSSNFTAKINPTFIAWKNREQTMFTFLNSTLSPAILALTVGQKFARGVWRVLEKRKVFLEEKEAEITIKEVEVLVEIVTILEELIPITVEVVILILVLNFRISTRVLILNFNMSIKLSLQASNSWLTGTGCSDHVTPNLS